MRTTSCSSIAPRECPRSILSGARMRSRLEFRFRGFYRHFRVSCLFGFHGLAEMVCGRPEKNLPGTRQLVREPERPQAVPPDGRNRPTPVPAHQLACTGQDCLAEASRPRRRNHYRIDSTHATCRHCTSEGGDHRVRDQMTGPEELPAFRVMPRCRRVRSRPGRPRAPRRPT